MGSAAYKVGDRVRVCCVIPHKDMTGRVDAVEVRPWGVEYHVIFDDGQEASSGRIAVGVCIFREG